eukprot:TRINITY_DN33168_c0_g1_i1.p1 TRINITY_DN33168_c0_g1~~TRINITY_DN33168_c0_g1_i1.p1  ORF type:complete len:176 (+),score=60.24 TRINITY_DN33168_c0_g1_i1:60-587(+)
MAPLTDADLSDSAAAFALYDEAGAGSLPSGQLGTLLRALGYNPSEAQVQAMRGTLDKDGVDGSFDLAALQKFQQELHDVRPDDYEALIEQSFKVFDKAGSGTLSAQELKDVLMTIGDKLSVVEADDLLRGAEVDADGRLGYKAFAKVMLAMPRPDWRGAQVAIPPEEAAATEPAS